MATYLAIEAAEPVALLFRLTDQDGAAYQQADVTSIAYTVKVLDDPDQETGTDVSGHVAESLVVADTIYDALQTGDDWTEDDTGYNFRHFLSAGTAFADAGKTYRITYTFVTPSATFTVESYVITNREPVTDGYCTPADVFAEYGRANVTQWADLDNRKDGNAIAARVAQAIDEATNEVDDRLRNGGYVLPFDPVPTTIRKLAARYAGVWLYESRGIEDYDETSGKPQHRLAWQRQNFEKVLTEVRAGKRALDAAAISRAARHGGMVPFGA